MQPGDEQIERLFRASRGERSEPEMPFGFDTRVVALARATSTPRNGSVRLLQRVVAVAMIVTAAAAAGTWWQFAASDSPISNAYSIADNAIDGVLE